MFLWILVGIGIGYFFKPQIDGLVKKVTKMIRDNRNKNNRDKYLNS